MQRLHARIQAFSGLVDIDAAASATIKFYAAGTGAVAVSGLTTTGTPFAGNLYAALTGGSPISTTQTADARGGVVVYTDSKLRYDVGIEVTGALAGAQVYANEAFELDPSDVMTSVSGDQSTLQTGTIAAPSLAHTGNTDTGFNVDSGGDPAVVKNGIGLLEAFATSTVLRSPDGTAVATLTDTDLFTAPGLLRMLGKYIVSDHGLLEGGNSTNAAGNTTALQVLWDLVSDNGGGEIIFPGDAEWPLNATLLDAQPGFSQSMSIHGSNASTILKLYGPAGPFLDISPTSTSPLHQCGIFDMRILHANTVTSGATIRLGYTSRYHLDRVMMDANGAFHAIELITSASVHAHDSTFTCQNVANAVCVEFLQTVSTGGVQFTNCDLSGGGVANSRGLRFNNTALVDTVVIKDTSIKDHAIGIVSSSSTGDIQNFQMNGGHIDACATCISIQPPTGADYGTLIWNGVWMAGTDRIAIFSTTNGGTISTVAITGETWHNATVEALLVQGGVVGVLISNVTMDLAQINGGAEIGLNFASLGGVGASRVSLVNNVIGGNTAALSPLHFSAETKFHLSGGWIIGKRATYDGALSSARTIGEYSFATS